MLWHQKMHYQRKIILNPLAWDLQKSWEVCRAEMGGIRIGLMDLSIVGEAKSNNTVWWWRSWSLSTTADPGKEFWWRLYYEYASPNQEAGADIWSTTILSFAWIISTHSHLDISCIVVLVAFKKRYSWRLAPWNLWKARQKQWLVNCRGCIAQRCNFPDTLGRWSHTNVQEPQVLDDAEIYAVHFGAERPRITLKIRIGKETGTQNCPMIYILPKLLAQSHPILLPCYLHLSGFWRGNDVIDHWVNSLCSCNQPLLPLPSPFKSAELVFEPKSSPYPHPLRKFEWKSTLRRP